MFSLYRGHVFLNFRLVGCVLIFKERSVQKRLLSVQRESVRSGVGAILNGERKGIACLEKLDPPWKGFSSQKATLTGGDWYSLR